MKKEDEFFLNHREVFADLRQNYNLSFEYLEDANNLKSLCSEFLSRHGDFGEVIYRDAKDLEYRLELVLASHTYRCVIDGVGSTIYSNYLLWRAPNGSLGLISNQARSSDETAAYFDNFVSHHYFINEKNKIFYSSHNPRKRVYKSTIFEGKSGPFVYTERSNPGVVYVHNQSHQYGLQPRPAKDFEVFGFSDRDLIELENMMGEVIEITSNLGSIVYPEQDFD